MEGAIGVVQVVIVPVEAVRAHSQEAPTVSGRSHEVHLLAVELLHARREDKPHLGLVPLVPVGEQVECGFVAVPADIEVGDCPGARETEVLLPVPSAAVVRDHPVVVVARQRPGEPALLHPYRLVGRAGVAPQADVQAVVAVVLHRLDRADREPICGTGLAMGVVR